MAPSHITAPADKITMGKTANVREKFICYHIIPSLVVILINRDAFS